MKKISISPKHYLSFIIIFFIFISPLFSQIIKKETPKLVSTKLFTKQNDNNPLYSLNTTLFNKIKVINNVNYHNYVYEFFTKSNRVVKGSVKEVGDSYVKVKILEGYKEYKYVYIPFENISHFLEHYSGE